MTPFGRDNRNMASLGTQVFLGEEFDEGLMVLRRLLGWHMIDVTYTNKLNISEKSKSFWVNEKGEEVHTRPRFVDLSVSVRHRFTRKYSCTLLHTFDGRKMAGLA